MCTNVSEKMEVEKNGSQSIANVIETDTSLTGKNVLVAAQLIDSINSARKKHRRGRSNRRKLRSFSETTISNNSEKYLELPHAPYNSNQFLIEDHGESDDLDAKLSETLKTHDSSFSYDSENDNALLSEGEGDDDEYSNLFEQEFISVFNTIHYDELSNLSKKDLLEKYIQLEKKYDTCMKILHSKTDCSSREDESFDTNTVDEQDNKDTIISISSNEDLKQNNEYLRSQLRRLRIENGKLKRRQTRLFAIIKSFPIKNDILLKIK